MSVIKNKRSLSDLEFFHNAIKLRTTMTDLLLRDFGIKAKNKNAQVYPKKFKMDKEDGERFMELCEKYQITSIIESYPDWLINEMRTSILENLRQLLANITSANSIYPVCIDEWTERRLRQDRAIGNCETLLQEMAYVIAVMPVDTNGIIERVIPTRGFFRVWIKRTRTQSPHKGIGHCRPCRSTRIVPPIIWRRRVIML